MKRRAGMKKEASSRSSNPSLVETILHGFWLSRRLCKNNILQGGTYIVHTFKHVHMISLTGFKSWSKESNCSGRYSQLSRSGCWQIIHAITFSFSSNNNFCRSDCLMLHHLSCCKWNTDSTIELQSLLRGNHVLMMIYTLYLCTILVSICHFSCAWQQQPLSLTSPTDASAKGRRSFFSDCSSVAASALLGSSAAGPLLAPGIAYAEDDEIIDVYFGCGCVRFQ